MDFRNFSEKIKSITIDIAEEVFQKFRNFLNSLPENSYQIYVLDPDYLDAQEEKVIYPILQKTENQSNNSYL